MITLALLVCTLSLLGASIVWACRTAARWDEEERIRRFDVHLWNPEDWQ